MISLTYEWSSNCFQCRQNLMICGYIRYLQAMTIRQWCQWRLYKFSEKVHSPNFDSRLFTWNTHFSRISSWIYWQICKFNQCPSKPSVFLAIFGKILAKFSNFRISENFRKISITDKESMYYYIIMLLKYSFKFTPAAFSRCTLERILWVCHSEC